MYHLMVSVIINTYNRGSHLQRLLDVLSRQTYENFEIVVVNGPSTDNTNGIIRQYKRAIRRYRCPAVNLSVSRNIGIRKAAGEIVAFIDDDAVPQDTDWIKNAVRCFEDDRVGIVGGAVYQLGSTVMFRYGWFDIFGHNVAIADSPVVYDNPKGERFSGGQGCNVFFRKAAVLETGGFDEYYSFYLEESDLCMRIIQHGYTCRYGENMAVIHEAASGPNRESEFHENLFVIGKSQGYFILKATEYLNWNRKEREEIARKSAEQRLNNIRWWQDHDLISHNEYIGLTNAFKNGIEQGIADSDNIRKLVFLKGQNRGKFRKFDKSIPLEHQSICILCRTTKENMSEKTRSLIKKYSDQGNSVFAVVRGEKTRLDLVDGVNYCFVKFENINELNVGAVPSAVYSVLKELEHIFGMQAIITLAQGKEMYTECAFATNDLYVTGDADKTADVITLRKTGIQYGPYITLAEGIYEVEYSGKRLQMIDDYHVTFDTGKQWIQNDIIEKKEDTVRYSFSVESLVREVEFVSYNMSDSEAEISGIKLRQIG